MTNERELNKYEILNRLREIEEEGMKLWNQIQRLESEQWELNQRLQFINERDKRDGESSEDILF